MAENKKSFVAYADWKETFDKLPDDIAGKLIKHIFAYVNDENPESNDYVIDAVFSNIKNTLKRDLKKWENQMEQRREAGKRSAEQRALNKSNERSISLNEKQRNPTVSVNDSVSVSESVSDIKKKRVNKFTPPTLDEVITYFTENGFNSELAKKAFNYYQIGDWKDSKGNQVKNWKQKMNSVWFKEENKITYVKPPVILSPY